MSDFIDQFIDHMREYGIGPENAGDIIADDKRRRYRVAGDKPKSSNGSYSLRIDGDFAFGWAMTFKDGEVRKWHSKSDRKWSAEEKAAFKKRIAKENKARDAAQKKDHEEALMRAKFVWSKATTDGKSAYLDRKQIDLSGARFYKGAIAVPMYKDSKVTGVQFIADDGTKRFMRKVDPSGTYFAIVGDRSKVIICEGYATAGSVHKALGFATVAAWNAGNLKAVAVIMRQKYPDAEIIIAADNDQWTTNTKGEPMNPGIEKAQQAAVAIGGCRVVYPIVDPQDPDKPTDWNDIAVRDGLDAVRTEFERVPDAVSAEDMGYDTTPIDDPVDDEVIDDPTNGWPFRALGYNNGRYFFQTRVSGQIIEMTSSAMSSIANLFQLAPYDFWYMHFGGDKISDGKMSTLAANAMIAECHSKTVFETEDVRGVGAWDDGNGHLILNTGKTILDGEIETPVYAFNGNHIYESGPSVYKLNVEPLHNSEAIKLRNICNHLSWKLPLYGDLLAGWLVIAPFGSVLGWRPHIWITGKSGAGKSTVLNEIVKPVLGPSALVREGATEAMIRKRIGHSGRPFFLDEAEGDRDHQRIQMQKILMLARRSSSGGEVENANGSFRAQSCYGFASINPTIDQSADENRITLLELKADSKPGHVERFEKIMREIEETITPEFAQRLQRRTFDNLSTLLSNEKTFRRAATVVFSKTRNGDQIGPMIAGLYMLSSTKVITFDEAVKWIKDRDWSWHITSDTDEDVYQLVGHIMTSMIQYDLMGVRKESSASSLIKICQDPHHAQFDHADEALRRYGMMVRDGMLCIANKSPRFPALLRGTPWQLWSRTLKDFPGADNNENKSIYFASGVKGKCVRIPLSEMEDGSDLPDVENIPMDEEVPF